MQKFMWQAGMRSVVFCVRECLSVLLDASIATTADSDPASNQPCFCWDDVIFIHAFITCLDDSLLICHSFICKYGSKVVDRSDDVIFSYSCFTCLDHCSCVIHSSHTGTLQVRSKIVNRRRLLGSGSLPG